MAYDVPILHFSTDFGDPGRRFVLLGCVWKPDLAGQETEPTTLTLKVGDLKRTALVFAPAASESQDHPLVFAFHGHGGNAQQAAKSFDVHHLWPEAVVVYPQGIPTPGRLTDPDGKRQRLATCRSVTMTTAT